MRLKEFIIFIIIFTVIYFLSLTIYDYYHDKKMLKKRKEDIKSFIDINKYRIFSTFYGINTNLENNNLEFIYNDLKQSINNDLMALSSKYSIDVKEMVVVVLFFEYLGLIPKRKILTSNYNCVPLDDTDDALVFKYSLMLSNQLDYDSLIKRAGINSDKELIYLNNNYLIPGIIVNENTISYVGDLNE